MKRVRRSGMRRINVGGRINTSLSTEAYWKYYKIITMIVSTIASLFGLIMIQGDLVVRWSFEGAITSSTSKWVLLGMYVISIVSLFATKSFMKDQYGKTALNSEYASSLSLGLSTVFTGLILVLVIYHFTKSFQTVLIGTIVIVFLFLLYIFIAYVRSRNTYTRTK